jgi:Domain of unknown function (DUF1911)
MSNNNLDFRQRRRQQFLTQEYSEKARTYWNAIITAQTANLMKPESEPGVYLDLSRNIAGEFQDRLFLNYTAGDPIDPLRAELEVVVAAFERYGEYLWKHTGDRNESVFKFYSLDEYCQLMQLVGLCFLLHRRDLLPRIAALQDGVDGSTGGADALFEELMIGAVGSELRYGTDHACHLAPYESLFYALTEENRPEQLDELQAFLQRWYKDLEGTAWYNAHSPEGGGEPAGYFGYWSFEAGAAVILLGIEDDSAFHKHLYYPKDLVAWCRENAALSPANATLGSPAVGFLRCLANQPCPREGWWLTPANANSRKQFKSGEVMPDLGSKFGATIWQWDEQQ